ncbi:MAG: NAD-dependent epimerase/dehydratase family protein [bacterium]|nr:NAD-dependent epimerase/dehydratase family protein [bacterium]
MKCLVTGVAGFIGSHLAERLIDLDYEVIGIDSFLDYYPREIKEGNIANLLSKKGFTFIEGDLLQVNLRDMIRDVDYIFHEAAQAGVRASWGQDFSIYVNCNILATQRLLEAAKGSNVKRFIYASSSSVYGDTDTLPMKEDSILKPISPYGVTKLAAENLCYLYFKEFGVPTISLRYFTVYGERQRPDMAFHRFIKATFNNEECIIYGDGNQTRDFTYIKCAIQANISAMESPVVGEVFNIGGGSQITLNGAIEILERVMGKKVRLRYIESQKGDVRHTYADTQKARELLKYRPESNLEEGLLKEVEWIKGSFYPLYA